jgi:alpha-beta hydrolase superfamily lysophospholipase
MKIIENWLRAADGQAIFYNEFLPDDEKVNFVVQIVHGMAEHSERYTDFAGFLVSKGGAVYASDHRGHGRNVLNPDDYGVWPEKKEWCTIVDDLKVLNDISAKNHPGVPVFILGHSMGSFFTRSFISNYSLGLKGVILTGTGSNPTFLLYIGCLIAKIQCFFSGITRKSKLLDKMSFGSFNKGYETPFQWLTRDQKIVDEYIADPKCGGIFSCSFYRGFMTGLISINKVKYAKKISKELPILFLSGANDPVGNYGKGVLQAVNFYKNAGIKHIEHKLYKDARHEILNEINKEEVYQDVIDWIDKINANG